MNDIQRDRLETFLQERMVLDVENARTFLSWVLTDTFHPISQDSVRRIDALLGELASLAKELHHDLFLDPISSGDKETGPGVIRAMKRIADADRRC